jgi:hypothetical protein
MMPPGLKTAVTIKEFASMLDYLQTLKSELGDALVIHFFLCSPPCEFRACYRFWCRNSTSPSRVSMSKKR